MNKIPRGPIKRRDTEGSALSRYISELPKPAPKPQINPPKLQGEKK